jgi:hypothetical protein
MVSNQSLKTTERENDGITAAESAAISVTRIATDAPVIAMSSVMTSGMEAYRQ